MKKVIALLCMAFAVCSAYAQTNEEVEEQVDTLVTVTPQEIADVDPETSLDQPATKADMAEFSAQLLALGEKMMASDAVQPQTPVVGKHRICQTLEIAPIAGKDKDPNDGGDDDRNHDGKADNLPDIASNINLGMNIGYTISFVPGKMVDGKFKDNPLGFAYNTGFIAAFDHQDKYEITYDFLGKFGLETGHDHTLGIGVNLLFGGGKSAGTFFDLDDIEDGKEGDNIQLEPEEYTMWCMKTGVEIRVRINLLTTNVKNMDVYAFARFVYSFNPQNDDELLKQNIINIWSPESFSSGISVAYNF